MTTLLTESFTTEIPVGFFTKYSSLWGDASDIVITYNAGQQAADIAMTGAGKGHIKFATSGTAANLRIVLDLETIAYTNTEANSGVGVGFRVGSQLYNHAFRIHLSTANNSNLTIITADGANPYDYITLSAGCIVDSSIILTNSNRNTYEFGAVDSTENTLYKQFYIKINSTLYWTLNVLSSVFPRNSTIVPYFFLLDSTYRMHSVDIYDDPVYQNPGDAFLVRNNYSPLKSGADSGIATPGVFDSSTLYNINSIVLSGNPSPGSVVNISNQNIYLQTDLVNQLNIPSNLVYQYYATKVYPQRGGLGTISGTIKKVPNTPVRRQVFLIRDRDMLCIQDVWSDEVTGNYTFTGIDPLETYTVISRDYTHTYNAVIADNLTPT
ncbi:MAG TPA: hypothetical protein V6C58_05280 [Allocoleopsis sp.]